MAYNKLKKSLLKLLKELEFQKRHIYLNVGQNEPRFQNRNLKGIPTQKALLDFS